MLHRQGQEMAVKRRNVCPILRWQNWSCNKKSIVALSYWLLQNLRHNKGIAVSTILSSAEVRKIVFISLLQTRHTIRTLNIAKILLSLPLQSPPISFVKGSVIDDRETEMMNVRWRLFTFKHQKTVPSCTHCFATMLLQ